jgi:hypothetical protein
MSAFSEQFEKSLFDANALMRALVSRRFNPCTRLTCYMPQKGHMATKRAIPYHPHSMSGL